MPLRRAQAPGAQLLPALALLPLLLGAGPRGGCLASPVPAAPLPAPGPCAAQPCRNGGVCTPRSSPGQEHPDPNAEPGYSCTCPAGVSGTDCQVSGRGERHAKRGPGTRSLSPPATGSGTPDSSFCHFRKGTAGLSARVDAHPRADPAGASRGSRAPGPGSQPSPSPPERRALLAGAEPSSTRARSWSQRWPRRAAAPAPHPTGRCVCPACRMGEAGDGGPCATIDEALFLPSCPPRL